jgi:hypothetical protein
MSSDSSKCIGDRWKNVMLDDDDDDDAKSPLRS